MADRYDAIGAALRQDLDVDPKTPITGDLSGQAVAEIMLANSLLKKREVWPESMIADQSARALKLFIESNAACQEWSWRPDHVMDDLFVGELRSFLAEMVDPQHEPDQCVSLGQLAADLSPGPGSSVGANSENFYTKLFESPLTATSEYLIALFRAAVCERPYWAEAEQYRFRKYGNRMVNGSTYFDVAKNHEIRRSCATEPNINMLFQKALGTFVEGRMKSKLNLSLADQPDLNRVLAHDGSISGQYGTIDLKSASDRNSMAMIEYFFPHSFTKWLKLFRSPTCTLPSGQELNMEMCSSMGNGFTFPLQTVLFVGVVATCYKILGIPLIRNRWERRVKPSRDGLSKFEYQDRKTPGNFGVFGDDIIVRSDAYDYVCRQLRKLGHIVNDTKSFNTGYFRESCGSDWFHGYNVRGVYVKSLETPLEVYSTINRLTVWSAKHGVNLSHTLRLLLGWVKFLPVPFGAADIEGVKVPYDKSRSFGAKRNSEKSIETDAKDWQCFLYRGIAVQSRSREVPVLTGENPENVELAESFASCEAGWAFSALGGYCATPPYRLGQSETLTDGEPSQLGRLKLKIGIRPKPDEKLRWKVKLKTAHCWPSAPKLPGPIFGQDRGHVWEDVAARHEFLKLL